MSKETKDTSTRQEKTTHQVSEKATLDVQGGYAGGMATPLVGSGLGGDSIESQANTLQQLSTPHAQNLMNHVGSVQGNGHVLQLMSLMKRTGSQPKDGMSQPSSSLLNTDTNTDVIQAQFKPITLPDSMQGTDSEGETDSRENQEQGLIEDVKQGLHLLPTDQLEVANEVLEEVEDHFKTFPEQRLPPLLNQALRRIYNQIDTVKLDVAEQQRQGVYEQQHATDDTRYEERRVAQEEAYRLSIEQTGIESEDSFRLAVDEHQAIQQEDVNSKRSMLENLLSVVDSLPATEADQARNTLHQALDWLDQNPGQSILPADLDNAVWNINGRINAVETNQNLEAEGITASESVTSTPSAPSERDEELMKPVETDISMADIGMRPILEETAPESVVETPVVAPSEPEPMPTSTETPERAPSPPPKPVNPTNSDSSYDFSGAGDIRQPQSSATRPGQGVGPPTTSTAAPAPRREDGQFDEAGDIGKPESPEQKEERLKNELTKDIHEAGISASGFPWSEWVSDGHKRPVFFKYYRQIYKDMTIKIGEQTRQVYSLLIHRGGDKDNQHDLVVGARFAMYGIYGGGCQLMYNLSTNEIYIIPEVGMGLATRYNIHVGYIRHEDLPRPGTDVTVNLDTGGGSNANVNINEDRTQASANHYIPGPPGTGVIPVMGGEAVYDPENGGLDGSITPPNIDPENISLTNPNLRGIKPDDTLGAGLYYSNIRDEDGKLQRIPVAITASDTAGYSGEVYARLVTVFSIDDLLLGAKYFLTENEVWKTIGDTVGMGLGDAFAKE